MTLAAGRSILTIVGRSLENPARQLYNSPLVDPARLTIPQEQVREDMTAISAVHSAVKATLEQARLDKVLGSSLQCSVILTVENDKVANTLERYADELDSIFVVSSVEVNKSLQENPAWSYVQDFEIQGGKVAVQVLPPKQEKCSRCWRYLAPAEDGLCVRCDEVVGSDSAQE